MKKPDPKAPTPAKFAHAVLKTGQIEEMVEFWTSLLNARVVFSNPLVCFLTYDDEHHRLAIASNPQLERAGSAVAGLDHLAFTYNSIEDLIATYRRLKAEGITPAWCINHGPTLSMYYEDPDGNKAELQIDVLTMEQAMDWMESPEFEANPIGIKFDPDVLCARYESGEPLSEITKRRSLKEGESFMDHFPG